jgi:hypothetical protein
VPISSTRLSCPLHSKAYVTSPVGERFRSWRISQFLLHTHSFRLHLPLAVYPLSSGLADYRAFLSFAPASLPPRDCVAAGLLGSPNITPVLRYYEPIHHRLVVSHFPGLAGYMTYPAPPISRWDEDGFSSCLACPCHRAVPNTPPECLIASVSLR